MTYPLFLTHGDALISLQNSFRLEGEEGRHAATVKRIRLNEVIQVTNGQGLRATGIVTELGKNWLDLCITEIKHDPKPSLEVTVVQAIAKGDRAELAVELMTEVGVWQIVPWAAAHSIAKWDHSGKSLAKWHRTAHESTKQARRTWVPTVREAHTTTQVRQLIDEHDVTFVLHESAETALMSLPTPASGRALCVIGPEGGISSDELELFRSAGAHIVKMGSSVMRTSTAGAIATAILLSNTSDW